MSPLEQTLVKLQSKHTNFHSNKVISISRLQMSAFFVLAEIIKAQVLKFLLLPWQTTISCVIYSALVKQWEDKGVQFMRYALY